MGSVVGVSDSEAFADRIEKISQRLGWPLGASILYEETFSPAISNETRQFATDRDDLIDVDSPIP
jgi:hypothetical protein